MSETTLFGGIIIFIVLLIICIHVYDRYLVKQISEYEEQLERKGIYKRHFIGKEYVKDLVIIKCKNCSKKFTVKGSDIPKIGRVVKCSHCSKTWRQMPNLT
tara:strand:- start:7 stop:309 length:303 start_codon:yes stop_codon:yes gene_type:complete